MSRTLFLALVLLLPAGIGFGKSLPANTAQGRTSRAAGAWDLAGVSDEGTRWIATLVLSPQDAGGERLRGHIDWLGSSGAAGRELVSATYDAEERSLSLRGERLLFSKGVVRCTYRAQLSKDGLRLTDGSWWDLDPTVPGTWSAERIPFD